MASTAQPAGKVPELVYQCYQSMAQELGILVPPADAASKDLTPEDRLTRLVESRLEVTQLRAFLQKVPTDDKTIAALIKWIIARKPRQQTDTDMIELLLVQYVATQAAAGRRTTLEDTVGALSPIIGAYVPFAAASRVADCVERLERAATLLDLSTIMQQLRKVKAACDLTQASCLMAFAWFSFSFRRRFIGLLRDEVERVEKLMTQLERENVHQIDASSCGMNATMSFQQLRSLCGQWHKPFSGNYSSGAWYEQVTKVREILEKAQEEVLDAEQAMAAAAAAPPVAATEMPMAPADPPAPGAIALEFNTGPDTASAPADDGATAFDESAFAATDAAAAEASAAAQSPEGQVDAVTRQIEEQLTKQRGGKTSAVTRVEVSGVKMMLSPDEVTCFRDSKAAERDLVVRSAAIRVLVTAASEQDFPDAGDILGLGNQQAEAVRERTAAVAQDNLELAAMLTGSSRALQKALDKLTAKMGN